MDDIKTMYQKVKEIFTTEHHIDLDTDNMLTEQLFTNYISSQLEPLVSEKFAGMVDNDTFKEVAEFVELEINEKHSNYWSNIAMGNASARFSHAYKKYASKFSR